MNQAIISIKPRYVDLVLSGEKSVELRNRVVRMNSGTRIWIYATRPVSGIVALAEVASVVHGAPVDIWNRFEREMCIDQICFESYTRNRGCVSALMLTSIRRMKPSVTLDRIRRSVGDFQPPQFYAHLTLDGRLSSILNGALHLGDTPTLNPNPFLITTQTKRNLSNRSGIGGVLSAT